MSAPTKNLTLPPSELAPDSGGLESFLERNQKLVGLLAVLAVVGSIGFVIYRGIEKSSQETAGAALTKAADLASYESVVKSNPGTLAAGSAMILLADSQWDAAKKDEAVATLRKFIADFPKHPAIPSAKANLGSKLLAQGKSGDAATVFNELVTDPAAAYIAPFALINLGDIARAAGDTDKASASYNKVLNEFPGSEFVDGATRRLGMLKTKPPVEIEPPPAPPAAPGDAAAPAGSEDVPPVQFTPGGVPTAPAGNPLIPSAPAQP